MAGLQGEERKALQGKAAAGIDLTGSREVLAGDLVVGNLEATLDKIGGLLAADGDVARDLLVTTDTEGTDSVAG